jgi:hypothetical protein
MINAEFTTAVTTFDTVPFMANLLTVIDEAIDNVSLSIAANTLANLTSLGGNVTGNFLPALGDSRPSNISIVTGSDDFRGLTRELQFQAEKYLGDGNYAIFCQGFAAADAYVTVTNPVIFAADRSNSYLGPTFTNQDDLISGDITRVNLATQEFGDDLSGLGRLIDFANLDFFGTPAGLLSQLSRVGNMLNGTLPSVRAALVSQGLTDTQISDLVNLNRVGLFNPAGLTPDEFDRLQKRAYAGLCLVTGADLTDVLNILEVSTTNINAMCDLLDPKKIFPRSYSSLTMSVGDRSMLIYDTNGSVSNAIAPTLDSGVVTAVGCENLAKIIPADQAAANRALQISFAQIKGIGSVDLPTFARAVQDINTLRDLPLVGNVATPISTTVQNFYANTLATGSGPLGTILLTDILGTPTGVGVIEYLDPVNDTLAQLISNNNLTTLAGIYARMVSLITGVYGTPPTIVIPAGAGAGSYSTYNSALQALITAADTEIGAVITAIGTQAQDLNDLWVSMSQHLSREIELQSRAGIDFTTYEGLGQNEITSFLVNLPGYGVNTQVGMSAQYLQFIANVATAAGQAVIATMRESRNSQVLDVAGVAHDDAVPDTSPVVLPQADLGDTTYTPAQARALVQARSSPG